MHDVMKRLEAMRYGACARMGQIDQVYMQSYFIILMMLSCRFNDRSYCPAASFSAARLLDKRLLKDPSHFVRVSSSRAQNL